ncbi:hypothetical protein GCM10009554_21260 [Kribbella koreensis]|uniref:Glycoside hydrolase family 42 N-terminal domain-containing protein n=1 Tax=Kribbella koreensis TaxID=57909 RepID=A0ABN1PYS4_9ACTN
MKIPEQSPLGAEGLARRAVLRGAVIGAIAAAPVPFARRLTGGRQADPPDDSLKSSSPQAVSAGCTSLPLVDGAEFPIGLFWPPHPFATTIERYGQMREAGFTFLITGNYVDDTAILNQSLSIADQVGLKVLVSSDPDVQNFSQRFTISDDRSVPMSITTADARKLATDALNRYRRFGSFAGFSLGDEPAADRFPSLAKAFAVAREVAPDFTPYSNLWPGEGEGYRSFVRQFVDTVHPPMLSFDRYPLLASGEDAQYFANWAIIRSEGLRANIPTWTFIQSVEYNNHRFPTAAELLWQINMSLAYGCKGIQYFTYWQPDPARGEGFGRALTTLDGTLTPLYSAAKTVNTTWLSQAGVELKPLVSELAVHANETPPAGATGFTPDAYLSGTSGSPVVLGRFRTTDAAARTRWLLVANRQHGASATTTVTLNQSTVTRVSLFDPATRAYTAQPDRTRIATTLAPGAAALYRLDA